LIVNRRSVVLGAASAAAAFSAPALANDKSPADLAALARKLVAANKRRIDRFDVAALVDFSAPSRTARLHLVDLKTPSVTSFLVSHGRGSDPSHTGWLQNFSNDIGSNASSAGAYRTGERYEGKHGLSMRLAGLDPDNSNAETRAIVVHAAWYVGEDIVGKFGKLGRSEGCFALCERDLGTVLDRLGAGALLHAAKF
jgi:hypothetical protein